MCDELERTKACSITAICLACGCPTVSKRAGLDGGVCFYSRNCDSHWVNQNWRLIVITFSVKNLVKVPVERFVTRGDGED